MLVLGIDTFCQVLIACRFDFYDSEYITWVSIGVVRYDYVFSCTSVIYYAKAYHLLRDHVARCPRNEAPRVPDLSLPRDHQVHNMLMPLRMVNLS